jgi:hypothetical protein
MLSGGSNGSDTILPHMLERLITMLLAIVGISVIGMPLVIITVSFLVGFCVWHLSSLSPCRDFLAILCMFSTFAAMSLLSYSLLG